MNTLAVSETFSRKLLSANFSVKLKVSETFILGPSERANSLTTLILNGARDLLPTPGVSWGVHLRLPTLIMTAALLAQAAIVGDVRKALSVNNLTLAEQLVNDYRAQHGITAELILAQSWVARAALDSGQNAKAEAAAKVTYSLATAQLASRKLDAEPQLPLALGAAIEVQSQLLAKQGERGQAITYLNDQLRKFGATSIRTRIQKNLNLLSLEGKPAPAIDVAQFLGPKPQPLTALRGKPVMLFFWAHWCGDCKAMEEAIALLSREYAGRFHLVGPTQHYGYVAKGEDAPRATETTYIDEVRKRYYADLLNMPVPLSEQAFKAYGASTTPTVVLIDSKGIVRLYHPGQMSYAELKAALSHLT